MHRKARFPLALFAVGMLFLIAPMFVETANAQVLYGSVSGTVKDQTGAVVPGATFTLTNPQTGIHGKPCPMRPVTTQFLNVLEGTYDISVKMTGFRNYLEKGISVQINTTRAGQYHAAGRAGHRYGDCGGQRCGSTDVQGGRQREYRGESGGEIPLGNYRNYQTLINLVPGTTPAYATKCRHRYAGAFPDHQRQRPGPRRQ